MTATDRLLARADTQLDIIGRRGGTGVPGTISLIRDLVAEVRRLTDVVAERADTPHTPSR